MRNLLLILLLLLFGLNTFAKEKNRLDVGLMIGVSSSNLKSGIDEIENDGFNDISLTGLRYGAMARINFNRFFIQPEVNMCIQTGEMSNSKGSSFFDLNTFDVPLLLGYKILEHQNSNLRVNAGPVYNSVNRIKVTNEDVLGILTTDVKDSYTGFMFGLGADIMLFTIDARIQRNFNILKSDAISKIHSQVFTLTVGVKLF